MTINVLIIGANFVNKGAQSMLFATVNAIKKVSVNTRIFFAHQDKCDISIYNFEEVYFSAGVAHLLASGGISLDAWKNIAKDYIRPLLRNGQMIPSINKYKRIEYVISKTDFIIDISGFALGSKWGEKSARNYIANIKLAKKYNIPIILMPQSFGPFDFDNNQNQIDTLMCEYMSYPICIFAREKDGAFLLREKYGLQNVRYHADMILSSELPDLSLIYKDMPAFVVPKVKKKYNVGVLPNMRSFDRGGDRKKILSIFKRIIVTLLERGKTVYLFRHSLEDIEPCRWIKQLFLHDERVILWENDFSCFEYDSVCSQFDFLVVGRYHGIVHAFRNNIPCIILGWAIKYKELAEIIGQEQYMFDITASNVNVEAIVNAIKNMDDNLLLNKKIIKDNQMKVQEQQICFDVMLEGIEDAAIKKLDK